MLIFRQTPVILYPRQDSVSSQWVWSIQMPRMIDYEPTYKYVRDV